MQLKRIYISAITTLLATVFMPSIFKLSAPFFIPQVLAQASNTGKSEADRLLNQGIQQYNTSQFKTALESWQQALKIYREIGDRRGEASSLGNLGNAYNSLGQYQKAIDLYQQHLAIAREMGDRSGESSSLGNLGSVYDFLGQYQKAIEFHQQSLAIAREINDRRGEAKSLGNLGNAYNSLGQYQKAIEFHQQSLAIAREISDRVGEANSLGNLGNAYNSLGQYQKAIEFQQQSLAIARKISDRRGEAKSLGNLGNVYNSLGQYQKAIEFQQQSLAIARDIGDRRGETYSLGRLGVTYNSLGQYQKAIDLYQQSLAIAREISDRSEEANSLGNLGVTYNSLGQYQEAIDLYQQSLAINRKIGNRNEEANSLMGLGNTYYFLGQYQKAIDLYQQSLTIARDIGDHSGEANSLGNLGSAYNSLGQYQKAVDLYQQTLAIKRKIGDRRGEGISLEGLGGTYNSLGQYQRAIEFNQQSLALARNIGDRGGEANSLEGLGNTYYFLGQYQKAIEFQQQSLAIARKIGYRSGESNSLNNLGLVFYKSGNLSDAEKTLFEGIKVYESLREFSGNDANKVSIFEEQARTYRTLQQVLIAQNKTDTALEITERGRTRAFVELLAKRLSFSEIKPNTIIAPNIEQIKQIAKTQNSTLVQYSIIYDDFKLDGKEISKESKLYIWVIKPNTEVVFREVDLKPLWQKQNTSLAQLVPSVRDAINVRGGNTNKITYAPGQYVKFKNDLKHWQPWEIISVNTQKRTLTVRQASYQAGLQDERSFDEVQQIDQTSLQQLYQIIIQPIADLLPKTEKERVVFIPQGQLFLVPFPALQDPQGKYLIEKHTILTAPSIQVLDLTRQQRQRLSNLGNSAKNILVVGNPIPNKIGELLYAEKEAQAIAQILNTTAITKTQATKSAIVSQMPQARIIHIAAHGILDEQRGLGSARLDCAKTGESYAKELNQELKTMYNNTFSHRFS